MVYFKSLGITNVSLACLTASTATVAIYLRRASSYWIIRGSGTLRANPFNTSYMVFGVYSFLALLGTRSTTFWDSGVPRNERSASVRSYTKANVSFNVYMAMLSPTPAANSMDASMHSVSAANISNG